MLRRILITSSILSIAASFSMASGCSSSSSGNPGTSSGSSGSGIDASEDTSGSSSGSASSSSGGEDSSGSSSGSSSSGGSSGSSSGSTSTCPPQADAGTFTAPTYMAATKGQGLCTAADTQAFVTACAGNNQSACTTWIEANVAGQEPDGGGAGTACGNCILNQNNNGAAWLDPHFFFGPNYAACIQLTDPTNGTACATAWNNINGCDGDYCDIYQSASTTSELQCCDTAVEGAGGECNSEATAFSTACAADLGDGGAAVNCLPTSSQANDFTNIINLVCGGGD